MTKGEQTRRRIVERAAPVFNTRGFGGASLAELVAATGLEKGGIYNHFASKEHLALAAFDYAVEQVGVRFEAALAPASTAPERLLAIISVFEREVVEPWLPGGCPVANTALEADDTSPALLERARSAMTSWHQLIGSIVKRGRLQGELLPNADSYAVATIVTSTLEGALMLSRLYDDATYMRRAVAHLESYVRSISTPDTSEQVQREEHRQ